LFKEKYPRGHASHPLYQYLSKFSFDTTPGDPSEGNEQEYKTDGELIEKKFKDISHEINGMTEPRKNMLNCEELFAIYLRECSTMVN
jgi:hypothetical protein